MVPELVPAFVGPCLLLMTTRPGERVRRDDLPRRPVRGTTRASAIIWLWKAMPTALQRASSAIQIAPAPASANIVPMTAAVSGVSFHGQAPIIKSGCRKNRRPMRTVPTPRVPKTQRTNAGTSRSLVSGVPGSVFLLSHHTAGTMNRVLHVRWSALFLFPGGLSCKNSTVNIVRFSHHTILTGVS